MTRGSSEVKVAKPGANEKAEDFIKNPDMPKLYTIRADYKVKRGDDLVINYQPYIVTVGDIDYTYTDQFGNKNMRVLTEEEKVKINKDINLPNLDGYTKPTEKYNVNYAFVKNPKGIKDFKDIKKNNERKYNKEFIYKPESNKIKIRHIFQHLYDRDKYGEPKTGDKVDPKEKIKKDVVTQQEGLTGTSMKVQPLQGEDIKGYEPEVNAITTQVPENVADFELIFRYNRKKYILKYDTQDGTPIPSRTIYYEQTIPRLELVEVPTKRGCEFQGWKPSVNLEDRSGKTYLKDNIIKDSKGNAIVDLSQSIFEKDTEGKIVNDTDGKPKNTNSKDAALDLIMPASNVTFTAVWKDKEKADYAVQFWAEKADHADGASLMDKYDYMGTRVYKDKDTGMRPNLDAESPGPVEVEVNGQKDTLPGLNFPDLDNTRLQKIWKGDRFNRGKNLYLNKFYVYNKDLTDEQNKDPKTNITKTVSATGQTVYNIYYDRQVYDLYFTKSNAQPEKNTIYPEIWGYDEAKGEAVMKGEPGNPYHYKARFNEMMYKWPNDAKQTKGFTPGYQSFGWGPNYTTPNWPTHLDTPPYRLNADEFLDMGNYTNWGGYTKHIDKGDGTTIDLEPLDFTTLSVGIKQDSPSIPHHMDFWMDGFKKGETIIRYDLVRTKADTAATDYGHKYPIVTGFTPYGYNPKVAWPVIKEGSEENGRVNEDDIDNLNDERDKISPNNSGMYYNNYGTKLPIGQLDFIPAFFSDSDEFGDVKEGGQAFTENGYLRFKYTRNKYPLRFNYDPSIIRDDSYFNSKNQLDTFYEFPLKVLSPDLVDDNLERDKKEYFKKDPKNLLDNPENLKKLGLTDLVENDSDGKLRVKRPKGLSNQMVFKGWALDPAGTKLIWKNPGEKMPSHPVNLYAKWGEPDFKWKVTYDPNGGELPEIDPNTITTENKTIKEGDIGKEKENTYPVKGFEAESEEGSNVKEGNKVFTVIQRQKLADTVRPWREGYDFMGWEFVKYKKSADGKDTDVEDKTYFDTYGVPEIYTFGNDVVSNLYLRAIWVKNDLIDIMSHHHYINADYTEDKDNVIKQKLEKRRIDAFLGAVGSRQNTERLLVPSGEFENLEDKNTVYQEYIKLKDASGKPRSNTYNQYIRVKKENTVNSDGTITEIPENKKYNEFHFFYRPFRKREYTVNYLDERGKKEVDELFKNLNLEDIDSLVKTEEFKKAKPEDQEKIILEANENNKKKFEKNRSKLEGILKKYQVITPEKVVNGNRDYDARNYRKITGWKLTSAPQQQLFFDVGKDNEFLGINGTGADQVFFYYKDVRVIEVPKDGKTPDGYVRVTFKAEKGGSFGKDEKGEEIKELHYDVIKGLISDRLPVPGDPIEDSKKEEGKQYITPDDGKKFTKWDSKPLLNENTIIDNETKDFYVFTAKFEWSGLSASGLVRTEAFKDSNNNWTNDFAPKIEDLKKQLVWKEKEEVKNLPAGAVIKLYGEAGNEITSDDQIYELVNEKKKADSDELVRTVNIKAKVTFKDGKEPQELDIPIKVYKNVYEALTGTEKPLFLSEAEKGELKDITGEYVKVIVNPTKEPDNKDSKVYYVNKKAWVDISEIDISDKAELGFTHWSADKAAQNENGVFDFKKRHMFTEKTVITPGFSEDVIHAKDDGSKPDGLPEDYVKVTFVPTEKATDETEQVFWVNPNKEVTIPVTTPIGKNNFTFKEWKIGENAEGSVYNPNTLTKFTEATIITATYDEAKNVIPYDPKEPITRPDGYIGITFVADEGITLKESKAYYVKKNAKDDKGVPLTLATIKNDTTEYGYPTPEANTGYEFTNWDPADTTKIGEIDIVVKAKSKKLENKIEKKDGVIQPKDYVEVKFVAGENGTLEGGEKIYYVNPNKYVTLDEPNPIANTGYSFGGWTQDASVPTVYKTNTIIKANFNNLKDVVPKTSKDTKMPVGYKTVTFEIEGNGGKIADGETFVFFVNPAKEVTLDPPATKAEIGYKFGKWDKDATNATKYTEDTTIKGSFKTLDGIIPKGEGSNEKAKPEGYVTVKFVKGEHGTEITGETVYYVNPKAGKKLSDISKKPTVKEETGWTFTKWDKEDATAIDKDITVTALYSPLPDVDTTKHPGYVKVKFVAGKNGSITSGTTVYYVNPTKYVKLTPPTAKGNTGYVFGSWSPDISNYTIYTEEETTIMANFNSEKSVIPKKNNDEKPENFVTVNFVIENLNGKVPGTIAAGEVSTYYVEKGKSVTLKQPNITANVGYKFVQWDQDTSVAKEYNADATIKGTFTELDPIVTGDQAKPEGYNTVTFKADDNGTVSGTLVYYVNPTLEVDLSTHANKSISKTANTGYKVEGGTWTNRDGFALKATFDKDTKFIYKFQKIKDIITVDENTVRPEGYVLVTFKADENGKLEGDKKEIKYYVNPKAGIKLVIIEDGKTAGENQLAVPKAIPNANNVFEKWYEDINTADAIVSDRTYVAKFITSQVELSYNAKGGTGTLPESVKVPYGTKVRLASAPKLKKENSKLIGWNIGGKIYNIGDEFVLKENTKAVAEWKLDTYIIPYDPADPKGRPDNSYIRISFEADEGLELSNVKYYYVKKGVNINLNNVEIERPVINTKVGFKSLGWDKSKTGVIPVGDKDIVIRATSKPLSNVVPAKDSSGNPQDKPTGYVEVKFVAAENGEIRENNIKVDGKVYYVNPDKYIVLTPPSTQGDIGYTFASWDKDATIPTKYESATTITASFNQIGDVIPKTTDDDSEKPEGYKTVTFVIEPATGGKIVDKETTTYYVDPNRAVTINPPLTKAEIGYEFDKWDNDTVKEAKKYTGDTIVKGSFKKIEEIIPSEDSSEKKNAQPNGYVKVVFDKGEDGKSLEGQKVYYVNPNVGKTLAEISHPTVTAKTGYKFTGWDTTEDTVIDKYYMVIAQYEKLEDVIPKIKDDGSENEKPAGYITVKFLTTNNGTVKGTDKREKVLFVNRNKAVVLESYAPEVTADNLHTFADWDTSIRKAIQYNDGDDITALYNGKDNIYETAKAGYVEVEFLSGENGKINKNEKTKYWVKPGVPVTVPAPKVTANTGFEFKDWDKNTTVLLNADDKRYQITAVYDAVADVIPGDLNKPNGYKTVTFKAENGTLSGTKVYYVNPNKEVDLKNEADNLIKHPNFGYTEEGADWDKSINTKKYEKDETYIFKFKELSNVDVKYHPGYVKVEFVAGDNGSIVGGNKTYYVNPEKKVKVGSDELPVPKTISVSNYEFYKWIPSFEGSEEITSYRKFVAIFKAKTVTLTYDLNGGKGTAPGNVIMPFDAKINLASSSGIYNNYNRFMGWRIDGKIYKPGDEYVLKGDVTAYAVWEEEQNIIEYDPENPITKPEGYVRVKFEAEEGLELVNPQYFYVRKGIGVNLGNSSIVKPVVKAKTGYEFTKKWNKDDSLLINDDIVVIAKSKKLDDVIDSEKGKKPEGYVKVEFVAEINGRIKNGKNIFYVNPNKYVTLEEPEVDLRRGFAFGSWSQDAKIPTVYEKDTRIIASFNKLDDVVPKTKNDDSEKPNGYSTVTFKISGKGGQLGKEETVIYYVNPDKEVSINPPKTHADVGYEFDEWNIDTTEAAKYKTDTEVIGNFKPIKAIIPSKDKNGDENPKPDGYVTVTFLAGDNGKLEGETVYYVNPKAGKTVENLKEPTIDPEIGFEVDDLKWEILGATNYKDELIIKNITIVAKYKPLADVKEKKDGEDKPKGYITVKFNTTVNGKIKDTQDTVKELYINPNKAVVLKDKAPEVTPAEGYSFARWDKSIDQAIQYKDGEVITALYNSPGDVSVIEVTGYVKVEFRTDGRGTLSGNTDLWIKPDTEVDLKAPEVIPEVGYKFDGWDKGLTVKASLRDVLVIINAKYKDEETIIPETEGKKPNGYVEVEFKAVNGSIAGNTRYYVNPKKEADFNNIVKGLDMSPNFAYTAEGATWNSNAFKQTFKGQTTIFTYTFKKLANVIPAGENVKEPNGYVKVTLIPTDKAKDNANIVYYVNPMENVDLKNLVPEGKEWVDSDIKYTNQFKGWTVTRGTVATWPDNITGKFIQDTEITATYKTLKDTSMVPNKPEPKDDVVTPIGDVPNAEALIKNIPGTQDKPLPDGTTFRYKDGKNPDLSKPGKTTVEVEVTYPGGVTTIVEVPITVVDNVVPQSGNEKPNVPGNYVKVTVDTTDKATDNTKFKKVFWVKPDVEVTLEGILAPTGKQFTEDGVTHDNKFLRWESNTSKNVYRGEIKDTFTRDTIITAVYEYEKNVEPKANDDQWIPQGFTPKAKDFIKNPYDDDDPNNKDNLPPGTRFEFVPGAEPDTQTPGTNKTTRIKVTYPNGEVKEVPIQYNVTGDVVEQIGDERPVVPDKFVKVTVDTTNLATRETYSFRTYWVNPDRMVKIPTDKPKGVKDDKDNREWLFDYWQVDSKTGEGTRYREVIEDRFTEDTDIKAFYYKADIPEPGSDYVVTDVNVFPNEDEYRSKITPPKGKEIARVGIIEQPIVSKPGRTRALIEVEYKDGTKTKVWVQVYVQRPGETNTRIVYRDKIVEKEKIVEKIIKIRDNQRLKEVRFMQGFEGKFRPHDGLTRAEAAQILANALKQDGYKYNPAYPINYKDVKQKWYTQAIVITTQANVFKGYDDGYFRPEEKISRAEWIATLKRFQQLKDADGNKMGLKANHWATREVEAAYEEGWLQIYTNGNAKFNANEPITREEVAAVTNKAFGRLIDRTYIMRNDKSVINYKDINPSMWSYVDILCASNSFIRDENFYMSHGIEYINSMTNSIEGTIIFNVQLKNLEIIQDKFQRYLR